MNSNHTQSNNVREQSIAFGIQNTVSDRNMDYLFTSCYEKQDDFDFRKETQNSEELHNKYKVLNEFLNRQGRKIVTYAMYIFLSTMIMALKFDSDNLQFIAFTTLFLTGLFIDYMKSISTKFKYREAEIRESKKRVDFTKETL